MIYFIYLAIFLLGLIIGSFINCIIYRLSIQQSFLLGRSFCPHCKKHLLWYDNIPLLSYLILRTKCRFCHKSISGQYPLVELITGFLFLAVFITTTAFYPLSFYSILLVSAHLTFTAFLIIIFIYDLKYYLILDKIILPAILIALILNLLLSLLSPAGFSFKYFLGLIIAALVAGGFFLIQFLVSRGRWIGGGDIRLGVLIGVMLGWPLTLVALAISYILGSLVGILLIFTKHKTLKSQIPLGTFLTLGTLVTLLWGQKILDWYLNITF